MSNSFVNVEIYLPEKYKDYFYQYCRKKTKGSRNDLEDSPFRRNVDMWFLAICLAVKEGLEPEHPDVKGKYKAIDGSVFSSDSWRSDALLLLAIADSGDIEIVSKPYEMIHIANGYALAGLPRLIYLLEQRGGDTALDYLSEEIDRLIDKS